MLEKKKTNLPEITHAKLEFILHRNTESKLKCLGAHCISLGEERKKKKEQTHTNGI